MKTQVLTAQAIPQAALLIQQGELVAFPTETVYGLGADALNEEAVKHVYQVKGRPSDNPLIVHVQNFDAVKKYITEFPEITQKLVTMFWPGPLTLIFKVKPGIFPEGVTGGLPTVAFRMPNNPKTLALIQQAGTPLVGPSANTSGKPSPTNAQHVLHDLKGKIAGVLDDGSTQIGLESTVLDLTQKDEIPVILRPGAVTKEALERIIGEVHIDQHLLSEKEKPKAPGMKYKHYAPDAPVWIVDNTQAMLADAIKQAKQKQKKIGLYVDENLAHMFEKNADHVFSFGESSVANASKYLFAGLRALDDNALDIIFAQGFSETGLGIAYMNRLKKAANQKFYKNDCIFQ